jgi:hypothetical protein
LDPHPSTLHLSDEYEKVQLEEDLTTIFSKVHRTNGCACLTTSPTFSRLEENIPSHTPLYRWFVDHMALYASKTRTILKDCSQEFLIDMLGAAGRLDEFDRVRFVEQHDDFCHYHHHHGEAEINACKDEHQQNKPFYAVLWRAIKEETEASPPCRLMVKRLENSQQLQKSTP